ncbi:DUF3429 domain-containing protein [Acidithiobacillus sp. IBUN Pt1247-S3]|uniref:DUF3429 domain-containing protein n=1 Tax=Acidithiobacillus sp. IBUN Pt1247-S3 TaxID=3166642 RepID=UPI0034E3AC96
MSDRNSSMRLAQILGATGLIPLIVADIGAVHGYGLIAVSLGNIYAAIILSFLGAIHWGLALDRTQNPDESGPLLLWSVIPALWGFFALWWSPLLATLILMLGFIAQWLADFRLQRRGISWPGWFFPLRSALTVGILILLAILAIEVYYH